MPLPPRHRTTGPRVRARHALHPCANDRSCARSKGTDWRCIFRAHQAAVRVVVAQDKGTSDAATENNWLRADIDKSTSSRLTTEFLPIGVAPVRHDGLLSSSSRCLAAKGAGLLPIGKIEGESESIWRASCAFLSVPALIFSISCFHVIADFVNRCLPCSPR